MSKLLDGVTGELVGIDEGIRLKQQQMDANEDRHTTLRNAVRATSLRAPIITPTSLHSHNGPAKRCCYPIFFGGCVSFAGANVLLPTLQHTFDLHKRC